MTSIINSSLKESTLYLEPETFIDYLSNQQQYYLFLDIDGTLANFTLDPKDSFIPNSTLKLLQAIQSHGVQIGIVTGRSLTEARQMLFPLQLPIAATHGLEIELDGGKGINNDSDHYNTSVLQVDNVELVAIKQAIIQSCLSYDDFSVEDKPYSVALHYRQNPALADVAYTLMSKLLANYPNWKLQQGKCVWEIVPKGIDKGTAILTILRKMQTNTNGCAIFIGDDITDEAGFMTVQGGNPLIEKNRSIDENLKPIKGMGIKVGSEPTCAHYYVNNILEVTILLESFLIFCRQHAALASELADTNLFRAKSAMRHTI